MDEPILPDATDVNGTAAIRTAEGSEGAQHSESTNDRGTADRGALRPTFLSGLAAAMREAAVRERERISSTVAADAERHLEKVRSRAAIESDELRRLADEDVEHIEQWSESELERIKREATRKVEERRSSLDEYLRQHDAIIETEIEGVNGAVRQYEATLDQFFAQLSDLTDPAEIVRRAGQLPAPPDLDEIRASARASAMSRFSEAEAAEMAAPEAVAAGTETSTEPSMEAAAPVAAVAEASGEAAGESVEAVAEAGAEHVATEAAESVEGAQAEAVSETSSVASDVGDGGAMAGVMDDGAGSVEPAETIEASDEPQLPAPDEAPVAVGGAAAETPSEPAPEPVGVMDPNAQRVPNWPAPAPEAPPAPISPTVDHTSAAVRLLRSVAPWTAPTHVGNRGSSDSD